MRHFAVLLPGKTETEKACGKSQAEVERDGDESSANPHRTTCRACINTPAFAGSARAAGINPAGEATS